MDIPATLGVMVLPRTILLPRSLLPLYIFESRYRDMLADALNSQRIFAIAHEVTPGSVLGSAGLIRACVANPDGTSHLMLQGIGRIRFVKWRQTRSYPFAEVEKFPVPAFDRDATRKLQDEIRGLCRDLGQTDSHEFLRSDAPCDGELFSDLAAANLVAEPILRRRLLEDPDVTSRLITILGYLRQLRTPE
jgi:Lon protease-like protein